MKIILASKSPRRKELLNRIYKDFDIVVKETDETLPRGVPLEEGVAILAKRKGDAAIELLKQERGAEYAMDCLVISSDTLVEIDGIPLGKPRDKFDAVKMLRLLSGREHRVRTGVCVSFGGRCAGGCATTSVFFKDLSEKEICSYVESGEPMDKAGAYGIQGEGGKFVEKIEGDFDTVVGLSLKLTKELVDKVTL